MSRGLIVTMSVYLLVPVRVGSAAVGTTPHGNRSFDQRWHSEQACESWPLLALGLLLLPWNRNPQSRQETGRRVDKMRLIEVKIPG